MNQKEQSKTFMMICKKRFGFDDFYKLIQRFSRSPRCKDYRVNPLSPHDALKHHFTFLKTDLISL